MLFGNYFGILGVKVLIVSVFGLVRCFFILIDFREKKRKEYANCKCEFFFLFRLFMEGRNVLEVVFRVFELGVVFWFFCCFWNWKRWVWLSCYFLF